MKKRSKQLNKTDAKYALKRMRDYLECSICCCPMTGSIMQCSNGHVVCQSCQSKCHSCPYCKDSSSWVRNLVLEDLLKDHSVECNNKSCSHVCKRKLMQDHLKICTYAPQKCPCCADFIHKDSVHQHFEDKHKE